MNYQFRCAQPQDADTVMQIIRERVDWMAKNNIHQWDQEYLSIYPAEYYSRKIQEKEIYLACTPEDEIVGLVAVLEQDPYWGIPSDKNSYYLHHLATKCGVHGAGKALLDFCEELARKNGKESLRLDCQKCNTRLNEFYASMGYERVDTGAVEDGGYVGIRREKSLQ